MHWREHFRCSSRHLFDASSYLLSVSSWRIAHRWLASKRKWNMTSCAKKYIFFDPIVQVMFIFDFIFDATGHTSSSCKVTCWWPQLPLFQNFYFQRHFKNLYSKFLINYWYNVKKLLERNTLSLFANWIIQCFVSGLQSYCFSFSWTWRTQNDYILLYIFYGNC